MSYLENGSPFALGDVEHPQQRHGACRQSAARRDAGVPAVNTQQYSFRDTRGQTGCGACGNV
jgi:hypothetical protein